MGFNAEQDKAAKQIIDFANKNGLPPDLLLAMAKGESDLNPNQRTNTGREDSYGTFQVNTRAHGGSPSKWMGAEGTERAMNEMKSRWTSAFNACGGESAWRSNPQQFFQKFWPKAQGCIVPTSSRVNECVKLGKQAYKAYV